MQLSFIISIMIIDDDPDDSEIFCETIHSINKNIVCIPAANGLEALAFLKKTSVIPNLIFLDLNMPRMNGKQCLKEIKKIDKVKDVPVVIYTTSKILDDVSEAKNLGAYDFITKPSRLDDIKKMILKIMKSALGYTYV